jgi:hypothetical protein
MSFCEDSCGPSSTRDSVEKAWQVLENTSGNEIEASLSISPTGQEPEDTPGGRLLRKLVSSGCVLWGIMKEDDVVFVIKLQEQNRLKEILVFAGS